MTSVSRSSSPASPIYHQQEDNFCPLEQMLCYVNLRALSALCCQNESPPINLRRKVSSQLALIHESPRDHPKESSSQDPQDDSRPTQRSVASSDGAYIKIVLAVLITTLPFLLTVTVLLYLVLSRRVEFGLLSGPELRLSSDVDDPKAYLVNFEATHLATLASWADNVASLISGFYHDIMFLPPGQYSKEGS